MDPVTIDLWPHPVTTDGRTVYRVPEGTALADAIAASPAPLENALAVVNGEPAGRERLSDIILRRGDFVQVRATAAGGGDDGSNPIAVIASIAVIMAAPWAGAKLAGAITGSTAAAMKGTFLASALTAGIGVVGLLVVNALFPPRLPALSGPEAAGEAAPQQYSLSGGANRARPYEPLLLTFGTHRVFPDAVMREYYEYDADGDQFLHMLFDFGVGDLEITDLRIGETPIGGYSEVQTESGTDSVSLVHQDVDTTAGGALEERGEWIVRTTQAGVTRYGVDLISQNYRVTDSGDIAGAVTGFDIEHAPAGSGQWQRRTVSIRTPSGPKGRNPVRRSFYQDVAEGRYDVRVRRTTAWDGEDSRQTQAAHFSALKGYEPVTTDFSGRNQLAVRIRATGQLHGRVDRLSGLVRHRIPVWDGEAWTEPMETSNPAWIFTAFCRGIRARRDGRLLAGMGLDDARIDIEGLKEWGAFCDASGLEFNYVLSRNTGPEAFLELVAQCGFASPTRASGRMGVVWEDPDEPVTAVFSPAGIVAGSLEVSYHNEQLADEITGRYYDRDSGYAENAVRRTVPGTANPQRPVQVRLDGITNGEQAAREINRTAAAQKYHQRTINWQVSEEGFRVARGSVVGLSHDLIGGTVGGRLTEAVSETRIRTSPAVADTGGTDHIWLWLTDGTVHASVYRAGADGWVTLETPMPEVPEEPLAVRFMTFADAPGRAKVRITAVEPVAGGRFSLTARDEEPLYYAAVAGDVSSARLPERSRLFRLLGMMISDYQRRGQGSETTVLVIRFTAPAQAGNLSAVIRIDGETVGTAQASEDFFTETDAEPGDVITVSAATGNEFFTYGEPLTQTYTVRGRNYLPAQVTGFTVAVLGDGTRAFSWDPVDDPDVANNGGYQIRYRLPGSETPWADMIRLSRGLITETRFERNSPGAGRYEFHIRAVSAKGLYSARSASVTVTLPAPRLGGTLYNSCPAADGWPGTIEYGRAFGPELRGSNPDPDYEWADLTGAWDGWGEWTGGVTDGSNHDFSAAPLIYTDGLTDLGQAWNFIMRPAFSAVGRVSVEYRTSASGPWRGYIGEATLRSQTVQFRFVARPTPGNPVPAISDLCWNLAATASQEPLPPPPGGLTTRSRTFYRRGAAAPDAPDGTGFASYADPGGGWSADDPGATEAEAVYEVTLTQTFSSADQTAANFVSNAWSAVSLHEARKTAPPAVETTRQRTFYRRGAVAPDAPDGAGFGLYADPGGGWSADDPGATQSEAVWEVTLTQTFSSAAQNSSTFVRNAWSAVSLHQARTGARTEWSFDVPDSAHVSVSSLRGWNYTSNRPEITGFGAPRYLGQMLLFSSGQVQLNISSRPGSDENSDLTDLFETSGSIVLEAGENTLTIPMASADTADPYIFTPSNPAEVTAFYNAIGSRQGCVIRLRDYVA